MAICNDNIITINLNELVAIRCSFLSEEATENQIDYMASQLRERLTWDTLYGMVDDHIMEFFDIHDLGRPQYGQISPEPGWEAELVRREKNAAQFELVDLEGPSWTIKVPRRKKS